MGTMLWTSTAAFHHVFFLLMSRVTVVDCLLFSSKIHLPMHLALYSCEMDWQQLFL